MKTVSAMPRPASARPRPATLLLLAAACLAAPCLFAHPGHPHPELEIDEFDEFASAFLSSAAHPFSGLDHLLVALVAGGLAMASRGRSGLLLAAAFLGALGAGFAMGVSGGFALLSSAAAGVGLALLGLFALARARPATLGTGFLLAAMGFSQGAAHALPAVSWPVGAGLLAGTAALAGIGALACLPLRQTRRHAAESAESACSAP